MMSFEGRKLLIQLCVILLAAGLVASRDINKATLADMIEHLDERPIEEIANLLCTPHNDISKLFIQFDTVSKLVIHISRSADPKLVDCWAQYGEALSLANKVVTTSNGNVCDESKIALIEEFHHKYISKNRRDLHEQVVSQRSAPLMLTTFFIHYAEKVGRICREFMVMNLEDLTAGDPVAEGMIERKDHTSLDDILDKFSQSFLFDLDSVNQKYMFLLWSLIDDVAYEAKDNMDFSTYVHLAEDLKSGQQHRVTLKLNDVAAMQSFQNHCRQHLKPYYDMTVLPVIRLIDMGYYFINIDRIPERWYKATQLCEAILPIRFVADSSLASGQVVLVPKEEAMQIPAADLGPSKITGHLSAPTRNTFNCRGLWWVVHREDSNKLWKDIAGRKDVVKRYITKMGSKVSTASKMGQGSFYLASRRTEGTGNEDITQALGETMSELSLPTKSEVRKEKMHKFAHNLVKGMKKATKVAIKVLSLLLKIVGGFLLLIVLILLTLLEQKDQGGKQFGEVRLVSPNYGGGMSLPMVAMPAIAGGAI